MLFVCVIFAHISKINFIIVPVCFYILNSANFKKIKLK